LEKYYPTKEVWRFLQKPVGLDLDKTLWEATREARLSLLYFFIFEKSIINRQGFNSNIPKKR
jgi:hypothetical protein